MSRPIKFRGKRIDNGEWEYGYYHEKDSAKDRNKAYIIPSFASALYSFEVDPETVGQYTGRADRNDKEIYRGDVLELTYVVTKGLTRQHRKFTTYVDWSDSILGFCLRNMDGTWNSEAHMYDFKANAEVIGNIYDHPHLLKGDDTDATT